MTEAEIQQQLAEKLEQDRADPIPAPQPSPTPPEKEDEAFHNNLPLADLVTRNELMDYFDIPSAARHSVETEVWVNKIMDWARDEGGSSNIGDLLRVINAQETTMGSRHNEQRVYKLYQYIRIHEQRQALAERERSLYG